MARTMRAVKSLAPLPTLLFFSSQFINSVSGQITTLVIPIYLRDLGFRIVDLGVISAGLGVGLMIFEPIWGLLGDRVGAKKIFTLTMLSTPLIEFSYTLARDLTAFAALRFVQGAFVCGVGVSSRVLARTAFPKGGRAFGVWWMVPAAAGLIGPTVGGYAALTSYNLAFYIATAAASVACLLSLGAPSPRSTNPAVRVEKTEGWNAREKTALIVTSSSVIVPHFLLFAYRTFVPVFAKESPKFLMNPVEIGLVFTAYGVVGLFAPLLFGELSDRIGRKKIILLGMVLQALSFLLLPVISGIMALGLTAVVMSFGNAAVNPPMMALLTDNISASKHGLALGLYGAGEDIGIWIGPLVVGYVYQNYGAESSFYTTAGLMFLSTVLSVLLLRKIER